MPVKKNIITVSTLAGRAGSSLTMGLLQQSGAYVGNVGSATDDNNPKGYFEVHDVNVFLYQKLYPQLTGFMPYPVNKNDTEINKFLTEKNLVEFEDLFFKKCFPDQHNTLAIKTPFMHTINLFDIIAKRNNLNVTHVFINRNLEAVMNSAIKINTEFRTTSQWMSWLQHWQRVKKQFTYNLEINFNDWFSNPAKTYNKLHAACKLPIKLSAEQVNNWINPTYKHW